MSGVKFIIFCFFDGNSATNGRGNDVFFSGSDITQSPFQQCGSTTPTKRVWNAGTADSDVYNSWLPIINQNKIVANGGSDIDACGKTQQSPCATVEYAFGCVAPFSDASLSLLVSIFTPTKTLTFRAPNTKITGNGTDATTISSSGIFQPQPQFPQSFSFSSPEPISSFHDLLSNMLFDYEVESTTTCILELARSTLVSNEMAMSHNSFCKPFALVIDCQIRFSEIVVEILSLGSKRRDDKQRRINGDILFQIAIPISHSVDNNLKALRIVQDLLEDSLVLCPHK
ncbi:uncharacterized protein MONOS_4003 [Monocercomonoides exilis]|uniref:uncharacterized protein n=1 Tax=Monocercomonoides exilis TaxID=2049356 RepID=UPI00355A7A53|nr:hypothetical protein MONOS_4003 [Monocercomonoides exilis]|eukprot:MONOS_4003.1-p1 / transcript=MONOS_4003.1 / gene=MONOS_4003 / organism=Monocercomonoides_exilis_PA203 / gene_product=unspecified product / transcript_product=unspecified product / location=Mono_scaffold00100:110371-111225(-) / protein_length=285 / sequence_SO=supercontig / SO=protein_coding / is_pseudo=false